jgi:hypothetical protein
MPNVPISSLPLTTSVCACGLVPIVQNGVTCATYACLLGTGGGGGVTQITAGTGVTISPACGVGNVTICSAGGGGVMAAGCGTCSIVGSGCGNNACGNCSFVGGGCGNTNSGAYSFIGSGLNNCICNISDGSVITGGNCNIINCISAKSFIGSGCCNNIGTISVYSTIVGGRGNIACAGSYLTIGGGAFNTLCGSASTISGGYCNRTFGNESVVSGGRCNNSCGDCSFVGGGCGNTALCNYTGVFGCNVCNINACSFMSNRLVACNIFGAGAICADASGVIVPVVSDERLKTNICSLDCGINRVSLLNPVTYNWIDEKYGKGGQIGFIAQEVEKVVPEAVFKTSDDDYGFNDRPLVALLTKTIQEQEARISKLEKLVQEISTKLG